MFGWFKADPEKKLQRQLDTKRAEAVQMQRNGRIREYAELMAEVEALEDQLIALGSGAS